MEELEIDFEDGPDYEPDEHVDVYVGTVRHACGHEEAHFNCNVEDLAGLSEGPCSACQPQPAADFDDPFADEAPE
jgi:hypothetical protein